MSRSTNVFGVVKILSIILFLLLLPSCGGPDKTCFSNNAGEICILSESGNVLAVIEGSSNGAIIIETYHRNGGRPPVRQYYLRGEEKYVPPKKEKKESVIDLDPIYKNDDWYKKQRDGLKKKDKGG